MEATENGPSAGRTEHQSPDFFSPETQRKLHAYRHHAANGLSAATSLVVLADGVRRGDIQNAQTGLTRTFTQAAWFARVSDKVPLLKKIQNDKFMLGLSTASMALRSPQLVNTLMHDNWFHKSLAALITGAYLLQVGPTVEKFVRKNCKSVWNSIKEIRPGQWRAVQAIGKAFKKAELGIDRIYNNKAGDAVLTQGPKIFMALNALGTMGEGVLQKQWSSVATGGAYLIGAGLIYYVEKTMSAHAAEEQKLKDAVDPPVQPDCAVPPSYHDGMLGFHDGPP